MRRALSVALVALLSTTLLVAGPAATADTLGDPSKDTSPDGVAPIVVLLDVSGSMNEDDGAGTPKLVGAKAAVRDIVGSLSGTTVFGLWTFPGTGCDGGGYVAEPAPLGDRSAALRGVDGVTADGDTPTGIALRSLADDLTQRGYGAATIVLVSDGESTCGPPPCDVANDLVDEGFNVTVPTIGFRTSDEGTEELACIAEATGAKTFAAGDSKELAAQLDQLVRAQIELTVTYDKTPMPGSSMKITATLKHVGGEAPKDIRVALSFADPSNPGTRQAAIPPVVRLGNILQGETLEYTWTTGTGPRDTVSSTSFTLVAWGSNTARTIAGGDYTTAIPKYTKDELGEVFSGVSLVYPLFVFGDSYSSGEGVGSGYLPTPDGIKASCHRNQKTYLGTIFTQEEMKIVACSNAVRSALLGTSDRADISQVSEMRASGLVPGAGILTFGGNDIGFPATVRACIDFTTSCGDPDFRTQKVNEAEAMADELAETYRKAWSALNTPTMREQRNGTYVPLVVLPYPAVTWEPFRGRCYQFGPEEVITADRLATALNGSVERAVNLVRDEGYEVYFVADVMTAVRPDHTLCESGEDAFIHGWLPLDKKLAKPESVHPKASGYLAETDAIIRWAGTAKRITPSVTDDQIELNLDPPWPPLETLSPSTFNPQQTSDLTLVQGGDIQIQGSNYQSGTPVTIIVQSDPVVLGTLVADADGRIQGTLGVPASLPVGSHDIVTSGLDQNGAYLESRVPLSVIQPTPFWVWAALACSILALIAAVVFLIIGLTRRRRATRVA